MADVTVAVEAYPLDGATGLVIEQSTSFGWVEVLDTAAIGAFPNYTTEYTVTVTLPRPKLRHRWKLGTSETNWFTPLSISEVPTDPQIEAITSAIIYKAARFLMLPNSPLGAWGEFTEGGVGIVTLKPDYAIREMLYGLGFMDWDVDLTTLVTTNDVIRVGLESKPAEFPPAKLPDVQRAIDSAIHWVAQYLIGGGVAIG